VKADSKPFIKEVNMLDFYTDQLVSEFNPMPTIATKKQLTRWGILPRTKSPTKGIKQWEEDGCPPIWYLDKTYELPDFTCALYYDGGHGGMLLVVQDKENGRTYLAYGRDSIQLGPFTVLGTYYNLYRPELFRQVEPTKTHNNK
jgi:hypothetical protein